MNSGVGDGAWGGRNAETAWDACAQEKARRPVDGVWENRRHGHPMVGRGVTGARRPHGWSRARPRRGARGRQGLTWTTQDARFEQSTLEELNHLHLLYESPLVRQVHLRP